MGTSDTLSATYTVDEWNKLTENEDFASFQRTLEFFDEVIVPWDWLGVAVRGAPSRFRCIGVASLDHHANSLERIGDDLALRRTNDVGFASEDQDEDSEVEHDET